jgi:hypothetical protein
MATLQEIYTLAQGMNNLHARVASACLKASWAIRNESPETENHTERLAWANAILSSKQGMMDAATMMFLYFLSNTTIQTLGDQASDNDIEFVVSSFINVMAVQ